MLFDASKSTTPQIVSLSFRMGAASTYFRLGLIRPLTPFKLLGSGVTEEPSVSQILFVSLSRKHRTTTTSAAVFSSMGNRVFPNCSVERNGSQKPLHTSSLFSCL